MKDTPSLVPGWLSDAAELQLAVGPEAVGLMLKRLKDGGRDEVPVRFRRDEYGKVFETHVMPPPMVARKARR